MNEIPPPHTSAWRGLPVASLVLFGNNISENSLLHSRGMVEWSDHAHRARTNINVSPWTKMNGDGWSIDTCPTFENDDPERHVLRILNEISGVSAILEIDGVIGGIVHVSASVQPDMTLMRLSCKTMLRLGRLGLELQIDAYSTEEDGSRPLINTPS